MNVKCLTALAALTLVLPAFSAPPFSSQTSKQSVNESYLPPFTKNFRVNVVTDCGAVGDGRTNDTRAFQRAAKLLESKGGGTLVIPRRVYIVGEQTHESGSYPYFKSEPIFLVKNVHGLLIDGNGATLKLASGLRFGAFDKDTGEVMKTTLPFYDDKYGVGVGAMLQISNSENIVVRRLSLDGNISQLKIGGLWGDKGRQLWGYGLHFYNNRHVVIEGVDSHHQALDGMIIGFGGLKETDAPTDYRLSDCRFEYNARQGLSWVGGIGLRAERCKFNHTGRAGNQDEVIETAPAAGLDIEPEESVTRDGDFRDCEFIDNYGCGMVADGATGAYTKFQNCTFWGTTSYSAWCNRAGLKFEDSRFYGGLVYAVGSSDPTAATSWKRCVFEDRPWVNGKVYNGDSTGYLIELNGKLKNVIFDGCSFTANKCKSMWIDADPSARVRIEGCTVTHKFAGLPEHNFMALLRHVVISNTSFRELLPKTGRWHLEAQDAVVEGDVTVEGPAVRWQNWSSGTTGRISP